MPALLQQALDLPCLSVALAALTTAEARANGAYAAGRWAPPGGGREYKRRRKSREQVVVAVRKQ